MPETVRGVMEVGPRGPGHLRQPSLTWAKKPADPVIPDALIRRFDLRPGATLEGPLRAGGRHGAELETVTRINGLAPPEYAGRKEFEERLAVDPTQRLRLETAPGEAEMRALDLLCPIGRGQRALIVAAPRTGKTMLLQKMGAAIAKNHPEVARIALLID